MYELCVCVSIVYLCKWPSNDLLSYLFINIYGKWYLHMYVQYMQICVIWTYIHTYIHQFTFPPSHPAEFYFVSFVCWQSNGNNQQQEKKLNLPPLSAKTRRHTHTHTHSCLCVRCYPLNQLCGSSALLGSFFSPSLSLFALLLLLLQSKKLLMHAVSSPLSVSFPL